jgi:hypothetical protein
MLLLSPSFPLCSESSSFLRVSAFCCVKLLHILPLSPTAVLSPPFKRTKGIHTVHGLSCVLLSAFLRRLDDIWALGTGNDDHGPGQRTRNLDRHFCWEPYFKHVARKATDSRHGNFRGGVTRAGRRFLVVDTLAYCKVVTWNNWASELQDIVLSLRVDNSKG